MLDKYSWSAAAYYSAKRIIARKYRAKSFLAETLLADVVKDIGECFDYRVWGGVVRCLSSDGYIKINSFGRAKSSRGSFKPKWVKCPDWWKK